MQHRQLKTRTAGFQGSSREERKDFFGLFPNLEKPGELRCSSGTNPEAFEGREIEKIEGEGDRQVLPIGNNALAKQLVAERLRRTRSPGR
jgi:hypothetical protein